MSCCGRQGQIVIAGRDGVVRQCSRCGQWWVTRFEGMPPVGFRGQWSGWVEWPISPRRARKLLKALLP